MLGIDPVKRGLNGYTYCDKDSVNQTDPTGEVANILLGGIAGGIIGGAFGFAGSALSQIAGGKDFSERKAWVSVANGAIVGAAKGSRVSHSNGNITEIVDEEQNKTVVTYDLNTYIYL